MWPRLLVVFGLIILCLTGINPATVHAKNLNVLVLYPFQKNLPTDIIFENDLIKYFSPLEASNVEYYFEYIDSSRFPTKDKYLSFYTFLRDKYRSSRFDLIIAVGNPAFDFILTYSKEKFFRLPIIFSKVTERTLRFAKAVPNSSILYEDIDIARNIDLALIIQPDLKRLFFVTDYSPEVDHYESYIKNLQKNYNDKVEFLFLKPSNAQSLMRSIENISNKSAIFYFPYRFGSSGEYYTPLEIMESLSKISHVPVYSFWDHTIGHGIIGGFMIQNKERINALNRTAQKLLQHEKYGSQIIEKISPSVFIFSWRELQRWKINEKQLPPGSVILFREETIWSQYKWHILIALSFMIFETFLIVLLLLNRNKRLRAEIALRQSETKLQFLTTQLINAQESERRLVSIELHDELGQALMTLKLQIRDIQKKLFGRCDDTDESFNPVFGYIAEINDKIHRLARDLSPALLEDLGLSAAIRWLLKDDSNDLKIRSDQITGQLNSLFKPDKMIIIYRIFQEVLTNIRKHAEAP